MIASGIGNIDVLLMLLLAHMLGDFAFQSTSWVEDKQTNKHRSAALYKHGIIHAILAMAAWVLLLGWSLDVIWVVIIIATTHCLIDILKSHATNHDISWFIVDQTLHIAVIIGVWSWFTNQPQQLDSILSWLSSYQTVAVVLAYFVVSRPTSILIGLICKKWASEVGNTNSLPKAGALIGTLERILILTFIFIQQFEAIGFLLAAKSILRFGGAGNDQRKLTEYVIVGTMLSFTLAIFIGLSVRWLVFSP